MLSCPTFVTPWTVARQAPLSMGFFRQEYWSGLAFSSPVDLPDPGIKPRSPALQADSLSFMPPPENNKRRKLPIVDMIIRVMIMVPRWLPWESSKRKKTSSSLSHIFLISKFLRVERSWGDKIHFFLRFFQVKILCQCSCFQNVFQSGIVILHFHHHCVGISVALPPCQHLVQSGFFFCFVC